MTGLLPELEIWIKVAGAAVAVLMAVLVPVRSWIIEDRRYRARTLEALSASSRTMIGGLGVTSAALADTLALSRLADGLDRVAGALERLISAEADRDKDRLTRSLERFLRRHGEELDGASVSAPASPPARDPTAPPAR